MTEPFVPCTHSGIDMHMQTVSALGSFFLAMVLNPDVQRKAQRELDQVVGPHRLPDFADQPSLPYVDAIVKETLRWNPVVPLGEGPMFFSYTPQRKRTVLKEGPPNTRRPPHAHGGRRVRRILPPQGHARRRKHLVSPH